MSSIANFWISCVSFLFSFALYLALEPSLYGTIRRTRIHKVICKSMYWNKFNIKFYTECRDIFMISKNVPSPYQSTNSSFENVECLEFHVFVIDFVVDFCAFFFSFAFIYSNSFLMPIYVVFSSYRFMNDVIMYLFILNITLYVSEITIFRV